MSVQGLHLSPGILKTCGPFGSSSHIALAQAARLRKGYMLFGKEVYFCNDEYPVLSVKIQFRICIPASDAIAGRFGEGVEEILGMKNGERGQMT
jgi:hypothetical protein